MRQICISAIILGWLGANACGSGSNGGNGVRGGSTSSSDGTGSNGRMGSSAGMGGNGGTGSSGSSDADDGAAGSTGRDAADGAAGSTGRDAADGAAGGGFAAEDVCFQSALATCERILRCEGANGLSARGYISVGDCAAQAQANVCSMQPQVCATGQTYHADLAKACVDALRDLSCGSHTTPGVCHQVCTDPPPMGGSISEDAFCKNGIAALCEKAFACGPDSDLADLARSYDSVASCTSKRQAESCSGVLVCEKGKIYRGDTAQKCVAAISARSCTGPNDDPPCEVCVYPPPVDITVFDPEGPGLSAQGICRRFVKAFCGRCADSVGFSSESACIAMYRCETWSESTLCPTGIYQPSKGLACASAGQTTSCTDISPRACDHEALCR